MPSERLNGKSSDHLVVQPPSAFRGFPRNRYTQVPDLLFDELLADLSNDELRVLLHVIRFTEGFKRDTDSISLTQFVSGRAATTGTWRNRGTGLSRAAVGRGIKGLVSRGILVAKRCQDEKGGHLATTYKIRFDDEFPSPPVDYPSLAGGLPWSTGEPTLVHRREPLNTVEETEAENGLTGLDKKHDEPSSLDKIWRQALVELEPQMTKVNFTTWFAHTRLVDVDAATAIYTIGAPNEDVADWLRTRCQPLIVKTLTGLTGTQPKACVVVANSSGG